MRPDDTMIFSLGEMLPYGDSCHRSMNWRRVVASFEEFVLVEEKNGPHPPKTEIDKVRRRTNLQVRLLCKEVPTGICRMGGKSEGDGTPGAMQRGARFSQCL
jgi:hypothetical protein